MHKNYLWAIIVILLLALIAILVTEDKTAVVPVETPEGIVCTLEARECPDGSYVGRTGPNCEFTPCPTSEEIELQMSEDDIDTEVESTIVNP